MSRRLLAFLAATLALRLVSIFSTGFCDDEAYTVTLSRQLALSYFDHPPLHQWLLAAWTAAFGEGRAARLPFLAFSLVTALALFGLTRRLFGAAAAGWAVFAFSANAYFLVYPDGYILPDPPVMAFCALGVWAVAEILFGPPGRETPLWLAAGLALGLAGLAKYSAIFAPLGLAGFFLSFAPARRWLADPRPYLAAALALGCQAPSLVWNARHHWVSFAFQSERAGRHVALDGAALSDALGGLAAQAAAMTPWIAWPLLAGLAGALTVRAAPRERFLAWLSLPPLALFALLPFAGVKPIAHWFNAGWLFAFPLAGLWLSRRGPVFQARFAAGSAMAAALIFALYLGAIWFGPLGLPRDPTSAMFDWPAAPLRAAYASSGADFVAIDNWRVGGRVGVALGPKIAICGLGGESRGLAFACDPAAHLGQNALIVRLKDKAGEVAADFGEVTPRGALAFGRNGAIERRLDLAIGRNLVRPPPAP